MRRSDMGSTNAGHHAPPVNRKTHTMTKLSAAVLAAALAAVAIPAAAQTGATVASTAIDRAAIAELGGTTRAVANWQALGLDPLPAGYAYGIKDSRIVVTDPAGAVVSIVRVVADTTGKDSGFRF